MITAELREQFLSSEFRSVVAPLVHEHFSVEEVRANLKAQIDADLTQGTDQKFAEGFRDLCPVEGASSAEYMIRHIEIETGLDILAGIRFRGLDLSRPFVAILHQTRPFATEAQLRRTFKRLGDSFLLFAPKAVLIYRPSHAENFPVSKEYDDKLILMGSIQTISEIPPVNGLRIAQAMELDFYERYREEYAIVTARSPDHLRTETAEREEDLKWCVTDGLTYKIYLDDVFAGVFIVTDSRMFGASGYYVIENLLFDEFRGKHLADSVQSLVASELRARGGRLLFGSIYPSNLPSYNAALRSKRVDIGGYSMVPINY